MYCNTIEIYYGGKSGSMVINIDGFFPCNQKDFNKLFKLIEKDFTRSDKILDELLKTKLPGRLKDEQDATLLAAKEAREASARMEHCNAKINNLLQLQHASGDSYREQLADERRTLKAVRSTKYKWDREFNAHERNCEKLERNIKQLEEYVSGR